MLGRTQVVWYAGRRCGRSPGGSGDGAVVVDGMAGLGYRMREGAVERVRGVGGEACGTPSGQVGGCARWSGMRTW